MDVVIVSRAGGRMSLQAFADKHGLKMVVQERDRQTCESMGHMRWPRDRYFAKFDDTDVMESGMLRSAFGNGATPEQAMAEYCAEIQGRRIAYRSWTDDRRNIDVPNELFFEESRP